MSSLCVRICPYFPGATEGSGCGAAFMGWAAMLGLYIVDSTEPPSNSLPAWEGELGLAPYQIVVDVVPVEVHAKSGAGRQDYVPVIVKRVADCIQVRRRLFVIEIRT